MRLRRSLLLATCALVLLPRASRGESEDSAPIGEAYRRLRFGLGYHFSSGKYDGSQATEIAYAPWIARADLGAWSFELNVPYIRISGPPVTAETASGPVQTAGGTQDGLGDITSRGSYTLAPLFEAMPYVELIGRVKYPTASRAKGLGTGELDYGFESELTWAIDRLVPFVGGGFRLLGSSDQLQLSDVWLASAGAMYRTWEPLWLGVLFDYRQAATASSGERMELVPFASWKVTRHWNVDSYVSAGLAAGSPDVGIGLQLAYTLF